MYEEATLFSFQASGSASQDTGGSRQDSRHKPVNGVPGRKKGPRQDWEGVTRVEWCDSLRAWNAYGFDCKGWQRFGFSKDDPWSAALMCVRCVIAVREQEVR